MSNSSPVRLARIWTTSRSGDIPFVLVLALVVSLVLYSSVVSLIDELESKLEVLRNKVVEQEAILALIRRHDL